VTTRLPRGEGGDAAEGRRGGSTPDLLWDVCFPPPAPSHRRGRGNYRGISTAAWAAASRAMGTRKGEQDT
jgi:hypothetical protein